MNGFCLAHRKALACLVVVAVAALASARAASVEPRINANRLQSTLEQLSTYGRPAGGTFADGVSRFAYSDADVAGREYAMQLMRAAGRWV